MRGISDGAAKDEPAFTTARRSAHGRTHYHYTDHGDYRPLARPRQRGTGGPERLPESVPVDGRVVVDAGLIDDVVRA